MLRDRKIKYIQLFLLLLGVLIIYLTYYKDKSNQESVIISETVKEEIMESLNETKLKKNKNTFFNIRYTGIDFSGNRYILTSAEATSSNEKEEFINMVDVNAKFYFKDETVLYVSSNRGIYNNKSLDIQFEEKVTMTYEDSNLKADKAQYSNSGKFLKISNNVNLISMMGKMTADELYFDLNKKKLNIGSFNNNNINATINTDEKRF
tara:strand:+ start:1478 stop:2098 length:621 start_codon:yes stop_codon:yes gene_type:complete